MVRNKWFIYVILIGLIVGVAYFTLDRYIWRSRETLKISQPVLAIVIDDFGGADTHGVAELMEMNKPITVAVMPNLINSKKQSEAAYKKGFEVILHQPMEPISGKASWLGPGAILSDMSTDEIKQTFMKNLATVSHAKGFNNHTGSKITGSKEKITPILEVAKEKGLFVLDSRTTTNSQVVTVAMGMHVPWVKRDVFLDDVKTDYYINKQIQKACAVAKKQGYAVAIGHVGHGGKVTSTAIKGAIPYIEEEGIKLVPLSEIVKLNSNKEKI